MSCYSHEHGQGDRTYPDATCSGCGSKDLEVYHSTRGLRFSAHTPDGKRVYLTRHCPETGEVLCEGSYRLLYGTFKEAVAACALGTDSGRLPWEPETA